MFFSYEFLMPTEIVDREDDVKEDEEWLGSFLFFSSAQLEKWFPCKPCMRVILCSVVRWRRVVCSREKTDGGREHFADAVCNMCR